MLTLIWRYERGNANFPDYPYVVVSHRLYWTHAFRWRLQVESHRIRNKSIKLAYRPNTQSICNHKINEKIGVLTTYISIVYIYLSIVHTFNAELCHRTENVWNGLIIWNPNPTLIPRWTETKFENIYDIKYSHFFSITHI